MLYFYAFVVFGISSAMAQGSVRAYVTDWSFPEHGSSINIPWDKLDHINYAFAIPESNGSLAMFNEQQLTATVQAAHSNGKRCSLSIGGWTGSLYFSSLVESVESRERFANNIMDAFEKYQLDGVDIDWEYPNNPDGVTCNQINKYDTPNLLKFLQLLKTKINTKYNGQPKTITMAVSMTVFNDENQKPSTQLDEAWATTVDYFQIMAYDVSQYSANDTGANAPLHRGGPGGVSAEQSIQAWISAGIPSHQLVLGVPFYGIVEKTTSPANAMLARVPIDHSQPQVQGDDYDSKEAEPCSGSVASFSGEIQWRSIQELGIPQNKSGWVTYMDSLTMTPYAYNNDRMVFLSYDDPQSLEAKAAFAKEKNLGGVMLWSLEMDDQDHSLLNALQSIRKK